MRPGIGSKFDSKSKNALSLSLPDTQSSCKTARSVGREFIVGFLQPPQIGSVNELHIAGASRSQSIISITAPEVFRVPVRKQLVGSDQFAIVNLRHMSEYTEKAVHVESTSDVSVVGLVAGNNTGAFLALPVAALGNEYFVATYYIAPRVLRAKRGNEFIIIGTKNGTGVNVTIRGNARYKGVNYRNGSTVSITVNRMEIVRFISKTDDLTGTHILSSDPVVVISGSKCADVPINVRYCDHLVEQMPPFRFWGSHFVTTPLAEREAGDVFRVMAGRNGTTVSMCGERDIVIDAGQFIERSIPSDVSCAISSSHPVLVLQYNKGGSSDKSSGDPSMTVVPALEQYFSESLFATVDLSPKMLLVSSYVNVALQCEFIPYVKHNMFPVNLLELPGSFNVTIAGKNICSLQIPLDRLGHNFFHFENMPKGRFTLTRYGNAISEIATSYSLPAGFTFNDNECFSLSDRFSTVPDDSFTKSSGVYSSISPLDHPYFGYPSDGLDPNLVTVREGLPVSVNEQLGPYQSNMLAVSLIIFMVSVIVVILLIGYVIFLKKRIGKLETEKKSYVSVPVAVGMDGYIVLDGSQIAHREYMTLNNSEEMWRLSRKSDKAVFRGIQPAHSINSHNFQMESSQRRSSSRQAIRQPSVHSQSDRISERENVLLMSIDSPSTSQQTNFADVFGNVNPGFNDAISISSQQDSICEIVSQPNSLRKPIRPVRRHHSHMEGFNTTTPVPKPRSHGPRVLRRSISTPGEHIFGGPGKVYYHVPRGDPVHAYDRPRQRTCSEGLSPSAAEILLPPEEDSKICSRKSSSNESESSLLPSHQQDDGYMSMKEATVSTISKTSLSEDSPRRESGGASYTYSRRYRKEPFDEDSTEYTELY